MSDPLPPTEPLPSTPGPVGGAAASSAHSPQPVSGASDQAGRHGPSGQQAQPGQHGQPGGPGPAVWSVERPARRRGPLVAALVVAVLLLVGSVGATAVWAHDTSAAQRGAVRTWDGMPGMQRYGWDGEHRPGRGAQPWQDGQDGQPGQPGQPGRFGGRHGTGPGGQRGNGPWPGPTTSARPSAPAGPSPTATPAG